MVSRAKGGDEGSCLIPTARLARRTAMICLKEAGRRHISPCIGKGKHPAWPQKA